MEEVRHIVENESQELQLKLPAFNNNEMLQMTHVALYLRGLVKKKK